MFNQFEGHQVIVFYNMYSEIMLIYSNLKWEKGEKVLVNAESGGEEKFANSDPDPDIGGKEYESANEHLNENEYHGEHQQYILVSCILQNK